MFRALVPVAVLPMALEHLSLAGFAHEGASSSRLVRAADAFSLLPLLRASYVPASAMTAGMHYCSCYTHVWEVLLFTLHGILDNSSSRSHWCLPFAPIVAPVFMAHREVQHSHSARRFTSNFANSSSRTFGDRSLPCVAQLHSSAQCI